MVDALYKAPNTMKPHLKVPVHVGIPAPKAPSIVGIVTDEEKAELHYLKKSLAKMYASRTSTKYLSSRQI
jgi:hypothetical protein